MRHLLLLRHAKAERDSESGRDHDRPLAERGRRAAGLMGRFLTCAGLVPDLVVTSTALRARTTAELALEEGGWRCPLRETAALYQASIPQALAVARSTAAGAQTLLLVGHEPTWSTLASSLMGGGSVRLPTAGLVHLVFDAASWTEVAPGSGVLRGLVSPALLEGL